MSNDPLTVHFKISFTNDVKYLAFTNNYCLNCFILPESEYITSPRFVSAVGGHRISFHFRFYGKYSEEEPQCAVFLEIVEMPDELKRVRIEVDMKCIKQRPFRQLLRTRVLSKGRRVTGFHVFGHEELERNESMEWLFAVKMFMAEQVD